MSGDLIIEGLVKLFKVFVFFFLPGNLCRSSNKISVLVHLWLPRHEVYRYTFLFLRLSMFSLWMQNLFWACLIDHHLSVCLHRYFLIKHSQKMNRLFLPCCTYNSVVVGNDISSSFVVVKNNQSTEMNPLQDKDSQIFCFV